MKVLVKPAFSNRTKNPYNYLLYSELAKNDSCTVEEFAPRKALLNRYDILHIHWPEVMLSDKSVLLSILTTVAFLALVVWMKLRGTRFVWTVHDLRSHNFVLKSAAQQKVEQWYWEKFNRLLDGVIVLSEASLRQAVEYHPELKEKPQFVIPHGHYKDVYPNEVSRSEVRKRLGIKEDEVLFAYFGQVRPYKNVPLLIEIFSQLEEEHYRLLIAGNPSTDELQEQVENLVDKDDRVNAMLRFIPAEEVQDVFKGSDLVVIPYKDILNSGSAILSLSFDVPVLVPGIGSIPELQEIFGTKWVKTYNGNLTADILKKYGQEIETTDHTKCDKIDDFSWDNIAQQTFEAYKELSQ